MTRTEAIMVLNMVEAHGLADEAKRMAIEALSAEEEKENGTFVNRDNCTFNCNDSNRTLVKVVRCKDCRFAEHREQMPNQVYCKRDKLSAFCSPHDDDDFCKYGERREPCD